MKLFRALSDPLLFWLNVLATLIGLLFIYDAGFPRTIEKSRGVIPTEFRTQVISLIVAVLVFLLVSRASIAGLRRYAQLWWLISFITLFLVFAPIVGFTMNGAARWIGIGRPIVQPAEFAKVFAIVFLAAVFADRKKWPRNIKKPAHWALRFDSIYVPKLIRAIPAIWVLAAVVAIEREPDLGTASVLGFILFVMMWVGGVSMKSMTAAVALCSIGVASLAFSHSYRVERIQLHQHRWDLANMDDVGYQTVQSEIGLAEGGLFGVGIGPGRTKHMIPAPTTDFIMATVGEETGLVGAAGILALMGAIVWRLFYLAKRAPTQFGSLVLVGIGAWIAIQAGVNALMANGAIFAIGIPMPYISSGGSSLVALWLAMAIAQVAMKPAPQKEEVVEADRDRRGYGRARLSRA